MTRRPRPTPTARDLTELFRTLSDETRFRLLRLLSRQELTVNELSTITQLAQPRISNHLKILREEKLIVERRAGSWRHYRVDQDQLPEVVVGCWPLLEGAWKDNDQFAADDKRLGLVMEERNREGVGSFFDQLAHRWDAIRATLFGDAIGRGILQAFIPKGLVVADVGTGTGYMLELFGRRAGRLIAIDHSETMLALAREKVAAAGIDNVDFRLADVQTTSPLAAGEADLVTIVQVLHHLDHPERAVAGLAHGIKPGGMLILSDFVEHQESWLRDQLHHRWLGFTQQKVERWMTEAGLTLESWDVLAGRRFEAEDGEWLTIPDSFIVVGRK
jgi:ArsR family transcriptional regulator